MDDRDVYPAEMPDRPSPPILPLDHATAERLLANRLDPDDAPPAYAAVARLLRAAAAPPCPDELAGQPAALAMFRAQRTGSGGSGDRAAAAPDHPGPPVPARAAGHPGRVRGAGRVRRRLVAVALAGALVIGGAAAGAAASGGLWTADGLRSLGRLRSPTGGPGTGGPGSGVPGVGSTGAGARGAGSGAAGGVTRGVRPMPAADHTKGKPGKAKEPKGKQPKSMKKEPSAKKPKEPGATGPGGEQAEEPGGEKPGAKGSGVGKATKPEKAGNGGPKAASHGSGNGHGGVPR